MLIIIMAIVLFVLILIHHRNQYIQLKKINSLIVIDAMEKERARIASDLHDDLGPILSVIKFQIGAVMYKSKNQFLELKKTSDQIDEVLMRIRAISYNLFPTILMQKGPFAAIEELVNSMERTQKMQIFFKYPPCLMIGESQGVQLFRIVQEALNNIYKHAKASNVTIFFSAYKNRLTLACEDNGIGFDMNSNEELCRGRGLTSIQNRTDIMGGFFYICSERGKGTILTIDIPLK